MHASNLKKKPREVLRIKNNLINVVGDPFAISIT